MDTDQCLPEKIKHQYYNVGKMLLRYRTVKPVSYSNAKRDIPQRHRDL